MKSCKKCEFCRLVKFVKSGRDEHRYYMCMRTTLIVDYPIIKSHICKYYLEDENWLNHKIVTMNLDKGMMDINKDLIVTNGMNNFNNTKNVTDINKYRKEKNKNE